MNYNIEELKKSHNTSYIASVLERLERSENEVREMLESDDSLHELAGEELKKIQEEREITLKQLEDNQQIIFRYCDENGDIGKENPNGAMHHIAGICNTERNVFGMMPHPERATSTVLGNTDGLKIFNSLILN